MQVTSPQFAARRPRTRSGWLHAGVQPTSTSSPHPTAASARPASTSTTPARHHVPHPALLQTLLRLVHPKLGAAAGEDVSVGMTLLLLPVMLLCIIPLCACGCFVVLAANYTGPMTMRDAVRAHLRLISAPVLRCVCSCARRVPRARCGVRCAAGSGCHPLWASLFLNFSDFSALYFFNMPCSSHDLTSQTAYQPWLSLLLHTSCLTTMHMHMPALY